MERLPDKWLALLFLLPFAAPFVIFQIVPLVQVVLDSLKVSDTWDLANYFELFDSPFYHQATRHSLEIAGWSGLLDLLITVLGSHPLRHVDSRLRGFVMTFSNMISSFAGVPLISALIVLFGFNGALTLLLKQVDWIDNFNLYSKTSLVILYTYFQTPLGAVLLYPALDILHEDRRESAALLGANGWQYWRHINIPVLTPAPLGILIILPTNTLGAYATVCSLTTGNLNVIPIRIDVLVIGGMLPNPNMVNALVIVLVGLMTLITLVHQWLLRRGYHVAR